MLRIAVPNKGSLAETAAEMLSEAGYTGRRDSKDLYTVDPVNEVEFFYLRPRDIATYVGSGALDVGITGRDLLLDARMPGAREVESLGFAGSTFRFAGRPGRFTDVQDLQGLRVATPTPAWSMRSSTSAASPSTSSRSMEPSSPPSSSEWRMPWPTSSRPARRCVRRGSRSSGRCCSRATPS